MQLNERLARQIVARAMKILSFSVNVMDERGLIIASGNPERIHQRHEGAVLALTENRVVEISEATALQLKGVRPGINLPISYQGELIGVIGIYVASAVYIGAFMRLQGKYRWPATLGVAVGVPAAIFALFELWFLVPLPKGPIERLLGF